MKKRLKMLITYTFLIMAVPAAAEEAGTQGKAVSKDSQAAELAGITEEFTDTVTIAQDCDVLDFPGRKDGEIIGEVLEEDEVTRTGTVGDAWSRIIFEDGDGVGHTGYIPTSILEGYEAVTADTSTSDGEVQAGIIHKSSGEGIFAEAVEGVVPGSTKITIAEGTPVPVSSQMSLKSLGTFRITHYCPCSICCGPWSDGITSTGNVAVTNRTIAVDPDQIPYGSKVVIDGQVYVAEDCGGAIRENCIDVYVGSHEEGESKGVYYTEVYLLEEDEDPEQPEAGEESALPEAGEVPALPEEDKEE